MEFCRPTNRVSPLAAEAPILETTSPFFISLKACCGASFPLMRISPRGSKSKKSRAVLWVLADVSTVPASARLSILDAILTVSPTAV